MEKTEPVAEQTCGHFVEGDDISKFCYLTGDKNKAHQGDLAVVPAFMLDFYAKRASDEHPQREGLQFITLNTHFHDIIRKGEKFKISHAGIGTNDGNMVCYFEIRKIGDEDPAKKPVAAVEVEYGKMLPSPAAVRYDNRGNPSTQKTHSYTLDLNQLQEVKEVLKLPRTADLESRLITAVSLSANALLAGFDESSGKQPFFGGHKLTVYDGFDAALAESEILLTVRADKKPQNAPPVYVRGESKNGRRIFDLQATIFYAA